MSLGRVVICVLALALVAAQAASAADVDREEYRYSRALDAQRGGPVLFEPDGPLFAHSAAGFADVRILNAEGEQIAWRQAPRGGGRRSESVTVLNSGRQGSEAVALIDFGARRATHDRLRLDIADRDFSGQVTVLGADNRGGPFTRLSSTGIYGISGSARPARSTVAQFAPTDHRYLQLRATGVSRIDGATVSGTGNQRALVDRKAASTVTEQGSRSVVTLDLGSRDIPVDILKVEATNKSYERPVEVLGSNNGRTFEPLAEDRVFRFEGARSAPLAVDAMHRYVRVVIENGDDAPLSGLSVGAAARSRAIVVKGDRSGKYTVLYGNRTATEPSYDFARIPASALGLDEIADGRLGAERVNPAYPQRATVAKDKSFTDKYPWVMGAVLALAAMALGAVGLLVLRGSSDSE